MSENKKVRYKKLVAHAFDPEFSTGGAAGIDLTAIDIAHDHDNGFVEIGTGLAFEIPRGYVGLLFPRSSISKTPHFLRNSVGVIDSDYRGEVKFRFGTLDNVNSPEYEFGDRVGQLVIMKLPDLEFDEVEELDDTERGDGGFGSTGK